MRKGICLTYVALFSLQRDSKTSSKRFPLTNEEGRQTWPIIFPFQTTCLANSTNTLITDAKAHFSLDKRLLKND